MFDVRSSSWLNSTSIRCLMGWWSCDAEMLKPKGMLGDRDHDGGLIRAKLRLQRW